MLCPSPLLTRTETEYSAGLFCLPLLEADVVAVLRHDIGSRDRGTSSAAHKVAGASGRPKVPWSLRARREVRPRYRTFHLGSERHRVPPCYQIDSAQGGVTLRAKLRGLVIMFGRQLTCADLFPRRSSTFSLLHKPPVLAAIDICTYLSGPIPCCDIERTTQTPTCERSSPAFRHMFSPSNSRTARLLTRLCSCD